MKALEHLWVIVLAGGSGERVSGMTSPPSGAPVPKQYCPLDGSRSMLRWALARALTLVPASRVVTVVAEEHRRLWKERLSDMPSENTLVEPRNRGTGAGLLLAASEIFLNRDREARLLVLPSDHFVAAEAVLRDALLEAVAAASTPSSPPVLLGMEPDEHDAELEEYGWILPAKGEVRKIRHVAGFLEKPDAHAARQLRHEGGLINSFMLAAHAGALVRIFERTVPAVTKCFLRVQRGEMATLSVLYEVIASFDFSRNVLARAPDGLSVLAVRPCGWTDLGTPSRLSRYLSLCAPELSRPPVLAPRSHPSQRERIPESMALAGR